jgi:hypothetical protein
MTASPAGDVAMTREKKRILRFRMKSNPGPSTLEVLHGLVERVTFHNPENGFCVLRVKARGRRDLVTVVGHAAVISAGEWITASGEWINDRAHGQVLTEPGPSGSPAAIRRAKLIFRCGSNSGQFHTLTHLADRPPQWRSGGWRTSGGARSVLLHAQMSCRWSGRSTRS